MDAKMLEQMIIDASKAGAFDVLSTQVGELKEEIRRLQVQLNHAKYGIEERDLKIAELEQIIKSSPQNA